MRDCIENKSNVIGKLINEYRKKNNLSKTELSKMLQLHAFYLYITEINRIEERKMIVKDFEIITLYKVLEINYDD